MAMRAVITGHEAAKAAQRHRGINVPIDKGLAIEANYFARMLGTHDIEERHFSLVGKAEAAIYGDLIYESRN
jgi:hypothetical protein